MTPSARIAAAIDALASVLDADRPADAVLSAFFRTRRYIGSKDRVAVAERVYAALRHHARLGWWLAKSGWTEAPARGRIAALLHLVESLDRPAIVALFDGSQYGPAALSQLEEMALDALISGVAASGREPDEMPSDKRLECPAWARSLLDQETGPAELTALLASAPLDLRVNERAGDRDAVLKRLAKSGVDAAPTALSPIGIRLATRRPLAGDRLFREGVIEIQDEGSQIVALLADAQPGFQVVDFCAGAGGKALAMAARMAGKGRIVACDVSEGRLRRTRERLRRAGVDNIEPKMLESETDRWVKRQKGKFDRVLIDAPCSGTGAWRRNPDARWRDTDLGALAELQGRILASAARLVKPGGRLIYATCSILEEENEAQIAAFVENSPEFAIVDGTSVWAEVIGEGCPVTGPLVRLSPSQTGTDGFFVSILERCAS